MSLLGFLTLRDFKPRLNSPDFPLVERLTAHRVKSIVAVATGDKRELVRVERRGSQWSQVSGEPDLNAPAVLFLTPRTVTCDAREFPALGGGNTESTLAKAVSSPDRARMLLRDRYEADRRYHIIPYANSRWALVFSVKESDVRMSEQDIDRKGFRLIQAWCGLASATKFALADQPTRYPDANAIIVADCHLSLIIRVRGGKPDCEPAPMEVSGESASIANLRELVMDRVHSALEQPMDTGTVALYSTGSAVTCDPQQLEGNGLRVVHHKISYSDLCFA